jgi:hypothetical protein
MTRQMLLVLTLILAAASSSTAHSREKNLDQWLDRELIPYVQQQLTTHPRFKDETVMFVVLQDNAPASISNDLALSLRDSLLEAAIDSAGISVGWRQGRSGNSLETRPDDCLRDKVHYYIGLDLSQQLDGNYSVIARALDLEDSTWVTGFGKQWHGHLGSVQRQAMRTQRVDETFLGARDVPFALHQTDLLAAHLAHQLSCTLKQQTDEEYVVATSRNASSSGVLDGTVELIGNNLAHRQALLLTDDVNRSNAILSGKAHQIDDALYQYWLTVSPDSDSDDLATLGVSAYIVLPSANSTPVIAMHVADAKKPTQRAVSIPNGNEEGLIGPLQILAPISRVECLRPCSMLTTRANADAIVFFLEHQANHGLVRLSGESCSRSSAGRVARNGDVLQLPIARTTTDRSNWMETDDWNIDTRTDTFFAVVATDDVVARRLANHINRLPLRCSKSMRPGLTDVALKNWLEELASITSRSPQHTDWRAIRVRNIT